MRVDVDADADLLRLPHPGERVNRVADRPIAAARSVALITSWLRAWPRKREQGRGTEHRGSRGVDPRSQQRGDLAGGGSGDSHCGAIRRNGQAVPGGPTGAPAGAGRRAT